MKLKTFAVFIGALLFFSACKKDNDKTYPPPITEPLTVSLIKAGDTLIIKGQNFSTVAAENTVEFNGVAGTVVSATATEIVVIVPANATSGSVTVTVHGNKTEVGTLTISTFTLYCIKGVFQSSPSLRQLVSIDLENGKETLIATINENGDKIEDAVYLPSTKEVIGRSEDGTKLIKINTTTKAVSTVMLTNSTTSRFAKLVVDKSNSTLYAVKHDWSDPNHYTQILVKLDPQTGAATSIKGFESGYYWESLVYLPASNEIVGLFTEGASLLKLNLTSATFSEIQLANTVNVPYEELVTDDQSNLYGYKKDYSDPVNFVAQIQKLNVTTGQATLVSDLQVDKFHNNLIYNPERKEIVSVYGETGLFRFNISTKSTKSIPLTTQGGIVYHRLIGNQ